MGLPDGMTIDEEGMLWICLWGGKALSRWNPHTGKLLEKIDIPAFQVTSCAFGGKDLDTLYITSARTGLSDNELREYPLTGSLFSIQPGVKGLPMQSFKGKAA